MASSFFILPSAFEMSLVTSAAKKAKNDVRWNAGDRTARHGPRDFRRHLAVAAADIENVLVTAQMKPADEFARPGLLHDGVCRVIRRVPGVGRGG